MNTYNPFVLPPPLTSLCYFLMLLKGAKALALETQQLIQCMKDLCVGTQEEQAAFAADKLAAQMVVYKRAYSPEEIAKLQGKELQKYEKNRKRFEQELQKITGNRWKRETEKLKKK